MRNHPYKLDDRWTKTNEDGNYHQYRCAVGHLSVFDKKEDIYCYYCKKVADKSYGWEQVSRI